MALRWTILFVNPATLWNTEPCFPWSKISFSQDIIQNETIHSSLFSDISLHWNCDIFYNISVACGESPSLTLHSSGTTHSLDKTSSKSHSIQNWHLKTIYSTPEGRCWSRWSINIHTYVKANIIASTDTGTDIYWIFILHVPLPMDWDW